MALRYVIPKDTQEAQRKASDPKLTAWVSANAGSGKTHVLTQRVIRLLLQGVAPSRILCLTFTKAAAANMSLRVFDTLAKWTALDDEALEAEIRATGADFSSESLAFARRLFARTVETPGGLKIQTIHAFCERLLHLFPFEANVASHFRVIEEEEQAELLQLARDNTLTDAGQDTNSDLGKALALVSRETNADDFNELIKAVLAKRDLLAKISDQNEGDLMRYESDVRRALGITSNRSATEIERSLLEDGIPESEWSAYSNRLKQGSKTDNDLADKFDKAQHMQGSAKLEAYLSIWLTQEGKPTSRLGTKELEKKDALIKDELLREQMRVVEALELLKSVECAERSCALMRLSEAILRRYRLLKQTRGILDFDDLIATVRRLLVETSPGWVLFKLDSGIDHILVDEAQDTSPAQWDILCRLSEEFMAGKGQRDLTRTFFAVGDEKQSIYSFQGADPRKFDEMRKYFAQRASDAQMGFENVPLQRSFRSARGILKCVDTVFEDEVNRKGLVYGDPVAPVHQALKEDVPSIIEIWPRVEGRDEDQDRDWRLPVDLQDQFAPPTVLANRIATLIRDWLDPSSPERVSDDENRGRPIRAGDIMILVRRRNAFFEAIIRALKEKDVPVAGADRLQLLESIAVMDLMAAGRAALLPQDDLSLACVLKSPLIGLTDDDLIEIAPLRPASLYEALLASTEPRHQKAIAAIERWRKRAQSGAFSFYAHLLGEDGGRRAMQKRLGPEARDAMDEFLKLALDHELREVPSLQNFLHSLQDVNIKRDMEAAGEAVRVLTAHAAKGLEAKIVFLPDTCSAPGSRFDPKIYELNSETGPLLLWSPSTKLDCTTTSPLRENARNDSAEEYRRLLYVAMTRAEERLYIMGFHGVRGPDKGCWYEMIERTMAEHMETVPAPWNREETVLRLVDGKARPESRNTTLSANKALTLPAWLTKPAPVEAVTLAPLRPSSAIEAADMDPQSEDARIWRAQALLAGRITHELLQHMGGAPLKDRDSVAKRYLARRGAALPEALHIRILEEVFGVLDAPPLRPLFANGSRAEVSLGGAISLKGRKVPLLGQIDRLVETDHEIIIADFKTGKIADDALPLAYATQLALYRAALMELYPSKPIRALLVWTAGPRIDEVTAEMAEEALRKL